jgi:hypothetical protein
MWYLCKVNEAQTKLNAMENQKIIEIILQEERRLWDDLLKCVHVLGTDDRLTDLASARYGAIYKLLQTLKLK